MRLSLSRYHSLEQFKIMEESGLTLSQRERILKHLVEHPASKADDLKQFAAQYGARILELRKQGYKILYSSTTKSFMLIDFDNN